MNQFQPLVAVGMAIARESCGHDFPECDEELEWTITEYVDGKISRSQATAMFLSKINNSKAIDRLSEILAIEDTQPLPPSNEKFFPPFHCSNSMKGQITPRKKARPWTDAEDTRLLAGIHKFGLDAWGPVTAFVGSGRSRAQCSQRWFRGLDPRISKVLWTAEEEKRLIQIVTQLGDHSWTKVANTLGNRSDAQCRYHYYQLMNVQPPPENGQYNDDIPNNNNNNFTGNRNMVNDINLDVFPMKIPTVTTAMSMPSRNLKEEVKKSLVQAQSFKNLKPSNSFKLPPITEFLNDAEPIYHSNALNRQLPQQPPPLPTGQIMQSATNQTQQNTQLNELQQRQIQQMQQMAPQTNQQLQMCQMQQMQQLQLQQQSNAPPEPSINSRNSFINNYLIQ